MASVDRLSALDAAFLDLDRPEAPLHVGAVLRLDGPVPTLAGLRRHLNRRMARVPRFRQRVLVGADVLGDAVWVDDAGFDVARHVHALTLPPVTASGEDATRAALAEQAGVLLSTALEADRPLWRMYLVRGLPDGGWALIAQIHHVLLDGVAAVSVAGLLLDLDPDAPADAAGRWSPTPAAGPVATTASGLRDRAGAGARAALAAPGQVREAGTLAAQARAALAALTDGPAATALDAGTGPERAVAFARVPLDDLREAGRRHRATVNDLFLTAASLALRDALERRGEAPEAVRALVPVDVRQAQDGALGNRISFLACDLPTGTGDPVRALRRIRQQMEQRKRAGEAHPLTALAQAADALPAAGRRQLTRLLAGRIPFTTIVSNVPGPPMPLYLLGARLREAYPAVPILHGRALTIGALSYAGTVHVGLYADAGAVDDLPRIAADLQRALTTLCSATAPAPTPWQARARAKRRDSAA